MLVELYGTTSEKDFITRSFQGLNQLESNFERLFKSVGGTLKNVKLNLCIDSAAGGTSISPSFEAVDEKKVLEELMNILSRYSLLMNSRRSPSIRNPVLKKDYALLFSSTQKFVIYFQEVKHT